jgi:hypothetical protein
MRLHHAMRRAAGGLLIAVAGAAAPGVAAAQAQTTFGADLSRPANAPFGCDSHPVGTFRVFNPDPNSCTWSSSGSLAIPPTESPIVPGDGTVTAVRVKTGPSGAGLQGTGPMQVVVLRSLGSGGGGAQCCLIAGASQVFTPAENAVTAVPMNLRVENNNTGGINTLDSLGLSVLAPGVRIPAYYDGANDLTSTVFSPAVQPGTQNVNRNGSSGAKLLINADWIPAGAARPIGLGTRTAPVRAGRALVDLVCGADAACRGFARLLGAADAATANAAAAKPAVFGSARIRLNAGQRTRVKVKLSRRGRALVRSRKRSKVRLEVRLKGGGKIVRTLVLKRPS